MKICVIGTGYVGLTLSCLADFGHSVTFIGRTGAKIRMINKGISPIYEPGLEEVLKRNLKRGRINATTNYDQTKGAEVLFVCVGTPSNPDGSIDLSQVESATKSVAQQLKDSEDFKVVAVKSTVVPGTTKDFVIPILEKVSGKKAGADFGVCMNPEFLKEGTGVSDFMNPDKIVLGCTDDKTFRIMENVYKSYDEKIPRVATTPSTAEMIKYAQNSALAARISFINEIANICEKYGVDVYEVSKAIGIDTRIGPKFLRAGAGFGGSCFPKDVKALRAAAKSAGVEPKMLDTILEINRNQPLRVNELLGSVFPDLEGKTIAVLGLAFKPNTDDVRESPSIPIVNKLIGDGAKVKVYDPKAMDNTRNIFGDSIAYCKSKEECIDDADACLIVTDWEEFKDMDISSVKVPIIDGRRTIDPSVARDQNLVYKGIGWSEN